MFYNGIWKEVVCMFTLVVTKEFIDTLKKLPSKYLVVLISQILEMKPKEK
jgi:hypothetical protein